MFIKINNSFGQSLLEYSILITILCVVFLTMNKYVTRAVRSRLVVLQNQVNNAVDVNEPPAP